MPLRGDAALRFGEHVRIMTVIMRRTSSWTSACLIEARKLARGCAARIGCVERLLFEVCERQQPGAQAVLQIVAVVGDVVGDRRGLRFEAGVKVEAPDPGWSWKARIAKGSSPPA